MPVTVDILDRKCTHFVLWLPNLPAAPPAPRLPPALVVGRFQPGTPPVLAGEASFPMKPAAGAPGLWELAAADAALKDGQVYHYWFEVDDTNPARKSAARRVRITDPAATTADWRLLSPRLPAPYSADDQQPAAVIKFEGARLVAADPGGEKVSFPGEPGPDTLPRNTQLVIYELPTAWGRSFGTGSSERGVGTFRDVTALIDPAAAGANFSDLDVTGAGRSYLKQELGINALELLPPADSFFKREWGYDTTHYYAPDHELGFPDGNSSPTANSDLAALVNACHKNGIRFFIDVVMAFARNEPYQYADFNDFFIADPKADPSDPDAFTSTRGYGGRDFRDGFGSTLWRYAKFVNGVYEPVAGGPVAGQPAAVAPARQHLLGSLARWMRDFHVDGVRLDSVENVANWDFVGAYKDLARGLWGRRWADAGLAAGPGPGGTVERDARIPLVVGEELSLPMDLVRQGRLDGLWNEDFQTRIRAALLGQNSGGEPTFEWTVRKAIDCRLIGFADGAQAVNYVTKHDVEGFRHERLYNMLLANGLGQDDIEKRVKLAFACLLTAVGIPMFLAGEEFADQHDRFDANGNVDQNGGKQVDPVDYTRLADPFRKKIFDAVARLVKLRTSHPALAVNDTAFIHIDFNDGKRVLVWQRGPADDPVVVVANFSDWGSDVQNPGSHYDVNNWPATPAGKQWREVSQDRAVPAGWAGREPLYPWEAKVYALG